MKIVVLQPNPHTHPHPHTHTHTADADHPPVKAGDFTEKLALLRANDDEALEDEYSVSGCAFCVGVCRYDV